MSQYKYESDLVADFLSLLESESNPWGQMPYLTECNYSGGRTDILALNGNGDLVAFEAKLVKWKSALNQAYRNTYFAQESYVLLPHCIADKATAFRSEFLERNVGLCSLSNGKMRIHIPATKVSSLNSSLTNKFRLRCSSNLKSCVKKRSSTLQN